MVARVDYVIKVGDESHGSHARQWVGLTDLQSVVHPGIQMDTGFSDDLDLCDT